MTTNSSIAFIGDGLNNHPIGTYSVIRNGLNNDGTIPMEEFVTTDKDGNTALHLAVINKLADIYPLLSLLRMSNHSCETALHIAARIGSIDHVKTILKKDPNMALGKNTSGNTPLHLSAEHGHLEVSKLLTVSKAERNKEWLTPLNLAVKNNHSAIAELLYNSDLQEAIADLQTRLDKVQLLVKNKPTF